MKKFYSIFIWALLISCGLQAQSPMARYPLTVNGIDTTGQNDDMELLNATFENGGVYSNGIYYGNDTMGTVLVTPPFTNFNYTDFSVYLSFYMNEYPDSRMPVLIGGRMWRWIGVYADTNTIWFMANDGSLYENTNQTIPLNQWNTLRISYNGLTKKCYLYLNSNEIGEYDIETFNTGDDPRFINSHDGQGLTFKGYWRDLIFYNSSDPTGINKINVLSDIQITTSGNRLTIQIPMQITGMLMKIIDLQGRYIKDYQLTPGTNSITIDKPKSGYLLVFSDQSGNQVVKKVVAGF